ncbi:uncharacterized protein FOMMEDRAFT_157383 [Fomitiporia mediterranea MF3/22]|uniref:uncharacterized protein n=1 Tax=Fomitiporia mediterranea (strain MF3/22) TaxID=694068 RepID=UPI00044099D1|nr:uncharacterized protein FOMMEDRAFT_157383 [Fomitiporia mediterranea MF3/22]EJD02174.1 hypothetical protein FOMMEDRAFT_157383 [Fomitiporia mediterranea MF3/22]
MEQKALRIECSMYIDTSRKSEHGTESLRKDVACKTWRHDKTRTGTVEMSRLLLTLNPFGQRYYPSFTPILALEYGSKGAMETKTGIRIQSNRRGSLVTVVASQRFPTPHFLVDRSLNKLPHSRCYTTSSPTKRNRAIRHVWHIDVRRRGLSPADCTSTIHPVYPASDSPVLLNIACDSNGKFKKLSTKVSREFTVPASQANASCACEQPMRSRGPPPSECRQITSYAGGETELLKFV